MSMQKSTNISLGSHFDNFVSNQILAKPIYNASFRILDFMKKIIKKFVGVSGYTLTNLLMIFCLKDWILNDAL